MSAKQNHFTKKAITLLGTALTGLTLAGALTITEAKAIAIQSSQQTNPVTQAKEQLYQTLQERSFRYFNNGKDLAEVHNGIMAVFEIEYETYRDYDLSNHSGSKLDEATFYKTINDNLNKDPELSYILTEEQHYKVFEGIYPKGALLISRSSSR
ncbi:hypothetical protein AB6M97_00865 [Streptococcus hillyeri]|uniref:Uncharacterized protein n=1 Tax=Streptococcus hillyeri TaxID=2282420 RepID=A0A3L9DN88_9STRE|nr:hypothetical protein [Streptococcus hillyeri]RLY02771.1 hypothetical protein EAF07_06660 [Streptococcus hillyeri]